MQDRTRYHLSDNDGNMYINADFPNEHGELVITMHMKPKEGLTPNEIFDKMGWKVIEEFKVQSPEVIPFKEQSNV